MVRLWTINQGMTYKESIAKQAQEDSNAYGQGARSIATRIKNSVSMVSDIKTGAGSDMFMLSSYLAHSLEDLYRLILDIDIPNDAKLLLANQAKQIEEVPSQFAQAKKIQQIEARRKQAEEAARRQEEMRRLEEEEEEANKLTDFRSTDFTQSLNVRDLEEEGNGDGKNPA